MAEIQEANIKQEDIKENINSTPTSTKKRQAKKLDDVGFYKSLIHSPNSRQWNLGRRIQAEEDVDELHELLLQESENYTTHPSRDTVDATSEAIRD